MKYSTLKEVGYWLMIVVVILLCFYVAYFMLFLEGNKCIQNPLVYGVNQFYSSHGDFTCTCSSPMTTPIYVTKDGMELLNNYDIIFTP